MVMLKNINRNDKADAQIPQIIENILAIANALNKMEEKQNSLIAMVNELDIRSRYISKYLQ